MSYFQYNWWEQLFSIALMVWFTWSNHVKVIDPESYLRNTPIRTRFSVIIVWFLWTYPGFDSAWRIAMGGFPTFLQSGWVAILWTLIWIPITVFAWPLFLAAVWPSRYGLRKYQPH